MVLSKQGSPAGSGRASGAVPHIIYGDLGVDEDYEKSDIRLEAHVLSRESDVIGTEGVSDAGRFWFQAADFTSPWREGDVVRIRAYRGEKLWRTYTAEMTSEPADEVKLANAQDAVDALQFELSGNYPNPFNAETVITYQVPVEGDVTIYVYNQLGQKIRTLVNRTVSAGHHQVIWDSASDAGNAVTSGVYFCRIEMNGRHRIQKMILLR